jgi:hypothetical protein
LKKPGTQSDYSVNVFSRRKGKTRSFNLNRRFLYYPVILVILLAASSFFFAQAFFQERRDRQLLEERVVLLGQLVASFETRLEEQEGVLPEPQEEKPGVPLISESAPRSSEDEGSEISETLVAGETEADPSPVANFAKIDSAKAAPLEGDSGFLMEFKLVNQTPEPISGIVVIVAFLKPPHQPPFVSYPRMELVNGMPVKFKRSVNFYIRRFKYVAGKFDFPFSHTDFFRILIYNPGSELISQYTLPVEKVEILESLSVETIQTLSPS